MIDLATSYMGLTLKNPIIIGSCGLTHSLAQIQQLTANGAAAVVLKSIFEEQILMEGQALRSPQFSHSEEADYIAHYTRQHNLSDYLRLIEETKKAIDIPVIASINCASAREWVGFAGAIEQAGADGLELNFFIVPGKIEQTSQEIEQTYFDILAAVKKYVKIPLAIKIGSHFTALSQMIFNLSVRGVSGIVLFNRFYRPDIDIDREEVTGANYIFSTPTEISTPLRWVGMLSKQVKCDLAAATGIHDGHGVIKCLLAGAKAVQVVSAIYREGPEHIEVMLDQLKDWMKQHNYHSLREFTGKLAQENIADPVLYERTQFMKYRAAYTGD